MLPPPPTDREHNDEDAEQYRYIAVAVGARARRGRARIVRAKAFVTRLVDGLDLNAALHVLVLQFVRARDGLPKTVLEDLIVIDAALLVDRRKDSIVCSSAYT